MEISIYNFTLLKTEKIEEISYSASKSKNPKCNAYEIVHKSGAKLLYLENDDPEMSFTVGFKTLPKDSTGVFHILEHSVLCGSRKFPVKEPFTNLLKSSMQTFLNAMTFPDKTIYPVASTNEKDLYNLIDVYMDAVLFPNIYKNKNIFFQEGGHKTLNGFSGVVYNEMQGVYSDPQEHIFEGLMKTLFPGSCYSYSSGGNPKFIKTLTYKEYLEQHNTNYNLKNAYIILYGNLDINKMLKFLDENYLSAISEIDTWRKGVGECPQGILENMFDEKCSKSPLKIELETSKENAECGAGFVFERNHKKIIAARIILDALCSSNESPLKKALLDENFAADIDFEILTEVYNPFVIIECKGTEKNYSDKLISTIQNKLKNILENGIPENLITAAISNLEFELKEKLPGWTCGLDTSINILSEWLYDENASTSAIKYINDIAWLKEVSKIEYFDNLAKEIFIDNKQISSVEVIPIEKKPKEKEGITENEKEEITQLNENLEKWQTTPDSLEDEQKIPTMKKSDVGKIQEYPKWNIQKSNNEVLYYDIFTNGITYVNRYYPLNGISPKDLFYVGILCLLLGKLDTKKYKSSEIDVIWQEKLGSLSFSTSFFENANDINDIDFRFAIKSASLDENCQYLAWFVDEIIYNTKFNDTKKIQTILNQKKVSLEQYFIACGHSCAMSYAASGILPIYEANEQLNGVEFYLNLKCLLNNFDKEKIKLIEKLKEILNTIFNNVPTITFAGENMVADINIKNTTTNSNPLKIKANNKHKNSAVIIPSNVNYCAAVNDMRLENINMDGTKIAASKVIALDYLWNEVRVKNGAYGAGMLVNTKGLTQYYSYRDPKIKTTFNNFKNASNWLKKLNIHEEKLDNYIISTIAKFDAPLPTRNIIEIQDSYYFCKMDPERRIKIADEILNTISKNLYFAADVFSKLNKNASYCVFGCQDIAKLKDDGFKIVDLFND